MLRHTVGWHNGKIANIFLLNYIYQTLNFLELQDLMPKANVIEHTGFPISSGMAYTYMVMNKISKFENR